MDLIQVGIIPFTVAVAGNTILDEAGSDILDETGNALLEE